MRFSLSTKITLIVVLVSLPALGLFALWLTRAQDEIARMDRAKMSAQQIADLWPAFKVAMTDQKVDLTALGALTDLPPAVAQRRAEIVTAQRA